MGVTFIVFHHSMYVTIYSIQCVYNFAAGKRTAAWSYRSAVTLLVCGRCFTKKACIDGLQDCILPGVVPPLLQSVGAGVGQGLATCFSWQVNCWEEICFGSINVCAGTH